MNLHDCLLFLALGVLLWIVGSVYFAYRGPQILESTALRYRASLLLSPPLAAALVVVALKLLHVAPALWASAALLIALPGLFGEAVALSNLSIFMPRILASGGVRYAALLFAMYAAALTVAETATLLAR